MKAILRTFSLALGATLLATVLAGNVSAQCGPSGGYGGASPRVAPAAFIFESAQNDQDGEDDPSIVGFWRVKFVSKGTTFIPDGTVIDLGFAEWHKDGTEIMNSSRPPATSSFCLGVWEKTGRSAYTLNHFALSFDPNGNMIGPANIREEVTLDKGGNSYSGTFAIDQFDQSGNLLAHITGEISATRITVDTKPADLA